MRELFDCRGSATHVLGVDDVLEVLQSDLSVLADGAAEHVLQPFQVLRRQLTPGTAKKRERAKLKISMMKNLATFKHKIEPWTWSACRRVIILERHLFRGALISVKGERKKEGRGACFPSLSV